MQNNDPIGYLVPEFPSQTHAFFWRELRAIEESGVTVRILSTKCPPKESCPHAFADEARARTEYLFPPNLGATLAALVTRIPKTLQAIKYIFGLQETSIGNRIKLLALVPTAMGLVQTAQRHELSHIHIHSCANAAHIGALGYVLGNLDYSLTLHGDLKVYGTDHKAKMRHAKFVSAVTRPLQDSLKKEIGPGRPYPVIWMGVDTSIFRPNPDRTPRDTAKPLKAVTIARLNAKKGHVFFLRAMAKLREEDILVNYQIAGDGPERDAIEAEVNALGLADQVTFLGSVSEDQVLKLLNDTDVAALTSFGMGEAAPVSVMEAMACGVPCIVSVIGGTPDMISHEEDGMLVEQKDVDAIVQALKTLAQDPERLFQLSRAARATAEKTFDHGVNALKLHRAILEFTSAQE